MKVWSQSGLLGQKRRALSRLWDGLDAKLLLLLLLGDAAEGDAADGVAESVGL